jgi:hypothetical protein
MTSSDSMLPGSGPPWHRTDAVGSVRRRGRRVRVELDDDDVALLVSLISSVLDLLEGDVSVDEPGVREPVDEPDELEAMLEASTGPVETPTDPALLRLLPDGYRNDDDAAGEFRRLTESGVRASKRAALERVIDDLAEPRFAGKEGGVRIDLDDTAADVWLPAITDVRLVFGTRIGITEDMDDERDSVAEGSLRYTELAVYDWMSWLQDAIVRALLGD